MHQGTVEFGRPGFTRPALGAPESPQAARPAWSPGHALAAPAALGQAALSDVGQVISLAVSGAATWVGLHTGLNQSGWLAAAGWVVGIGGAASVVFNVVGLSLQNR